MAETPLTMDTFAFHDYKAEYNMRINIWYISSFFISLIVAIPIITVFSSFFEDISNYYILLKNTFLFDKTSMIVKHEDVHVFLEKNNSQFDLIFADPPYSSVDLNKLFVLASKNLKPDGQLIIESSVRQNWNPENGKIRNYGDTQLTFFRNE